MRTEYLFCFALLFIINGTLRSQSFEWAYSGSGGESCEALAVAADSAGNIYAIGTHERDGSDVPYIGLFQPKVYDYDDLFLVRIDRTGTFKWVRAMGTRGIDEAGGVCVTRSGEVYVAGTFGGSYYNVDSLAFVGADAAFSGVPTTKAFLAKYDTSGKLLWIWRDTAVDLTKGYAVTCDSEGNAYMVGHYGYARASILMMKFSSDGHELWRRQATGEGTGFARSIAIDKAGDLLVAGRVAGDLAIDGTLIPTASNIWNDFVVKLGPDGDIRWARGEPHTNDFGVYAIGVDDAGASYLAGTFGGGKGFIMKYAADGTRLWFDSLICEARAIAVEPSGTFYITGNIDHYGMIDTIAVTPADSILDDIHVVKFDPDGHAAWFRHSRGNKTATGYGVTYGRDGEVFVVGGFGNRTVGYDSLRFGTRLLVGSGDRSAAFAKLSLKQGPSSVVVEPIEPQRLVLHPCAPNPGSGVIAISFDLPSDDDVRLSLHGPRGETIATLLESRVPAGRTEVKLEGKGLPAGIYYLRIAAAGVVAIERLILLR